MILTQVEQLIILVMHLVIVLVMNCNPLINGSASAVDSFKIPVYYSTSLGDSRASHILYKRIYVPGIY